MENSVPEQDTILFHITRDQAQTICEHFNMNIEDLAELLDRVIDEEL